jgi:hypothetical protein
MRLEAVDTRLAFNERRTRTIEGAVVHRPSEDGAPRQTQQYRPTPPQAPRQPGQPPPSAMPSPVQPTNATGGPPQAQPADGGHRRKRRRRRGRRGGMPSTASGTTAPVETAAGSETQPVTRDDLETIGGSTAHRTEPLETGAPPERESPDDADDSGAGDDLQ